MRAIVEVTSSGRSSLRPHALLQQHQLFFFHSTLSATVSQQSLWSLDRCYAIASLQLKAAHTTQCNSHNSHNFTLLIYQNTTLFNNRSLSDPTGPNFYLISGFVPLTLLLKAYDQCIYDMGSPQCGRSEELPDLYNVHPYY